MEAVQKFFQMLKDSAIMRQQFAALVVAVLSIIGVQVEWDVDAQMAVIIDGVLAVLSGVLAFWTLFTRATKPAPNLTETAKAKEVAMVEKGALPVEKASLEAVNAASTGVSEAVVKPPTMQGGYARASMLIALVALSACAVLGVPTPETFNQRAAFALTQVTAVRESATQLVTSGAISADDAQNIQDQANSARAGIDLAIVFKATDPENAENRLAAANVVID